MTPRNPNSSPQQPKIRIDLGKAGFIFLLAIYGFRGAMDYDNFLFIHNFDLIVHEAGHAIFRLLGEFIMFLGGTLMQLIVPIGITVYFFIRQERYSGAITLFWVSINLFDVSRYMKDARTQFLPLLGGEAVTHDWFYIFGKLNLLQADVAIGNFVYVVAFMVYMVAIALGFYYSCHE
ncbi:hypothetical protein Syn7502_00507 [Synechococcus sp. PCC 7502]|uniref:hypothetical protein n=1 Tax=Synechococcus sp. PCC 7502 TaxID=1173263 RepID=UPI00029FC876|nr:hypothetical protein [Synechococcus sp. PCC 7502]AFY72665.1 hypothetical protein Syn7502_00507 [Synechococcus sp. PCC 7502]